MKSSIDFSERFGSRTVGFRSLMQEQIRHILFVSSLYESFILAEDGHLYERVLGKFIESRSREPPYLTRVSSGRQALRLLERGSLPVDLIITSPDVGDMDAVELASRITDNGQDVPVAVLGYDHRELKSFIDRRGQKGLIAPFLWQGDARILLAIVRAVEDKMNAPWDTQVGVPVFMVVEDSVRFYSSFLPVIYGEVLSLAQTVAQESGNRLQRIMRMRARPKILLSTTYERALRDFEQYRGSIMGVFSDMGFPRDGEHSQTAGRELVMAIREQEPQIPIVLQSSRAQNEEVAKELGVEFLRKWSPDFLQQLRRYLSEHLFFGDFVFRDSEGEEIARAADLKSFVQKLREVPEESIRYHGSKHDFSRWLRARTEFGLAGALRPQTLDDYESIEHLRDSLVRDIDRYRRERSRGSVTPFRDALFDGEEGIVLIGNGSLGGKGRGLAFASRLLDEVRLSDQFEGVDIRVPPAAVLGTGVFDQFLDENDLRTFALQSEDEDETLERFLEAPLPEDIEEALWRVVERMQGPLAVRSSSILEDSPYQPLAGIYDTWLLPNDAPDPETRLAQLQRAIKRVYASTFTKRARAFLAATPYRLEEEAMAVVIQKMVGRRHGDRFYPDISGVARSHNFYPTPPAEPEDGIAAVALGLGKTVAEGEPCLRFSPAHPGHILDHSSVQDILEHSQRQFWSLHLEEEPSESGAWPQEGPLHRHPLKDAQADGTLRAVGGSYSAENEVVYDSPERGKVKLVTFAPILKHGVFPLAEILAELLALGRAGTRLPVEIEFAAVLPESSEEEAYFAFLQLRPIARWREDEDISLDEVEADDVVVESPSVLGNGRIDDLHDWIVVDRNEFDRSHSGEVAEAVARFNGQLRREGRPYGLIGVGRWGSTHPWLGIPVRWEDISGARVIVEAGFKDFKVTPSQGTHFYQNLASLNVGYFTVNATADEGRVDWQWFHDREAVETDGCVRHLRFDSPAVAIMNGHRRQGVVLKPK